MAREAYFVADVVGVEVFGGERELTSKLVGQIVSVCDTERQLLEHVAASRNSDEEYWIDFEIRRVERIDAEEVVKRLHDEHIERFRHWSADPSPSVVSFLVYE